MIHGLALAWGQHGTLSHNRGHDMSNTEFAKRQEAERKRRDELRKCKHSLTKSWVVLPDGTVHFTRK